MKKRLKIAEQILVVLSLALILPLVIASAIIINTNQIAVRHELESSATIIANSMENELVSLRDFEKNNLFYTLASIHRMPSSAIVNDFLTKVKLNDENILAFNLEILPREKVIPQKFRSNYIPSEKAVEFAYVGDDNSFITKKVKIDYVNNHIFDDFNPQGRQIYIFDENKNLIMSQDAEEARIKDILEVFPKDLQPYTPTLSSKKKNQPNIFLYDKNYNWYIVVSSPKDLTYYGILEARQKITLAICLAAIAVFIIFGFYTYYLYTNIRQFFKVIRSIADGNYTKKLRFITTPFTSQEVFFISDEFNKMLGKIDESYKELQESNKKLKQMDEYKSNLIDTVSHEFRTPLTSIKGYASSMLRHDIHLDEDSRKKSLKIIKQQAERLSRMVEDLLVIPDIESASLRMNYKEVNLKNIIETSVLFTSKNDTSIFNIAIQENLSSLYADEDRLIQIMINLLENALKYSKENTTVAISAYSDDDLATVKVHNEADNIDAAITDKLFEKFTRVDTDLTRTTRGTGLGLFIVKGLVETMGGTISLSAENGGFDVVFTIPVYKGQDNELA